MPDQEADDTARKGKKRDPLVAKVIRSTAVVIDATERDRRLMALTSEAVHPRAVEWSLFLLAALGRTVRVYDPTRPTDDPFVERDAAYWDGVLVTYTGPHTADQREALREAAEGILKSSNRKEFLYRLRQKPAARELKPDQKPPKGGPIQTLMTALAAAGLLPLRNLSAFDKSLDLAAWSVATGSLASWLEQDKATRANFAASAAKVDKLAPPQSAAEAFERFKRETGTLDTDITERLCERMKQFGFDVHGWEEEFVKAREIRDDIAFWLRVFEWSWQARRLARLRPSATVRLPDARTSRRMISFSQNHVPFRASVEGGRFVFKTRLWDGGAMVPVTLTARPTGYFRDLRLAQVASKSNHFARLTYRRGNNSPLPEEVTADLKVIRLLQVGDDFRVYLPLSFEQPMSALGKAAHDRHLGEPDGTPPPEGLRVLAADMGTNLFWATQAFEVRDGRAEPVGRATVGGVLDEGYRKKIRALADRVWACKHLINMRKQLAAGVTAPGRRVEDRNRKACDRLRGDGVEHDAMVAATDEGRRDAIRVVVRAVVREYNQLKRFDVYPSRQHGATQEMFAWLQLTKLLNSLLKKWSYYGTRPAALGERRPGFEARDRYFGNLKRDAVKKIAQGLVAAARRARADVIVIEDLAFGRTGALDNEFLDMWAPATIREWVQHFATQYGIWVAAVNPAHTSQVDPLTGDWGYRPKDDRKHLWVVRDGTPTAIHCDLDAAAANILNRFLDRARCVFKMAVKPVTGQPNCYVPVLRDAVENPKGKGWKRGELAHHLERLYGTEWVVIRDGVATPVTPAEFKGIAVGKPVVLYRRGTRWVTPAERRAVVDDIQQRCEAAASGPKIKPAKLAPKPARSRKTKEVVAA